MIEHLVLCKPCNRKWKLAKSVGCFNDLNLLELENPGGLTICKHVKAYYC